MEQWLIHFVVGHEYLIYAVIVLLACAEGPILSILFGLLIHGGYFHFLPVYTALMVGDLLGDCIWYWIGRRYGHRFVSRFGRHFGITEEGIIKATDIFHRHKDWILILSKVTNGFGFALVTLMTAGMMKIPFKRYMALNLLGQFVWSGILLSVGYYFGAFFGYINKAFGRLEAAAACVALAAVIFLIYKIVREKVTKSV